MLNAIGSLVDDLPEVWVLWSVNVCCLLLSYFSYCLPVDPQETSHFICLLVYVYHVCRSCCLQKNYTFPLQKSQCVFYYPVRAAVIISLLHGCFWLDIYGCTVPSHSANKCHQTTKYLLLFRVEILLQMFFLSSFGLLFGWFFINHLPVLFDLDEFNLWLL